MFYSSKASINSSGSHPPPPGQPWGICSSCQSRGWGIRNFIVARGLGISLPRSDPRAFVTRVFKSTWNSLSERTRPSLKTGLSVTDSKTITHKDCVNTTTSHFAFKTSLAIFKFMKVELKYRRVANSNDAIFKADLASVKCDERSFKMS